MGKYINLALPWLSKEFKQSSFDLFSNQSHTYSLRFYFRLLLFLNSLILQ